MVNVSFQSLRSGGKVSAYSVMSHAYTLGPQEIHFSLRKKKKTKKALAENDDFSNPSRTNLGKATLFWNACGCHSAAELESDQLLLAQVHLLLFTEKPHPGHPCRPGVNRSEASQVLTVLLPLLAQARHFLEEAQVLLQAQLLLYLRFQNPGTALGAAK